MDPVNPQLRREQPPYIQIAADIKGRIQSGELAHGARVPSEREIVEQWGVSRATAAKVLGTLRADGLVEARPGMGTVVIAPQGLEEYALVARSGKVLVRHDRCQAEQAVATLQAAMDWTRAHHCD